MRFQVQLLWKVLIALPPAANGGGSVPNLLFNLKGGRTFVRSLGGDFRLEHGPEVLAPTDIFHDATRELRARLGLHGDRFPYSFALSRYGQSNRVNIALHQHVGTLCATVRLDTFEVDEKSDWLSLQDLRAEKVLWDLVVHTLALAVTGDRHARVLPLEPQVLPALWIRALEADLPDWQARLVSAVTRHPDVSEAIVDDVLEKNRVHQLDNTRLLLDKQGVAAYVPVGTSAAAVHASSLRFDQSVAMTQLAAVSRRVLRVGRSLPPDLRLAISDPSAAIRASASGKRMWALLVLEFSLKLWLSDHGADPPQAGAKHSAVGRAQAPAGSSCVLLITVTTAESLAVRTALVAASGREPRVRRISAFTYDDYGRVGDFDVLHQISGMGSGGTDGSQESVRRGIQDASPSAVIMVGIAFGVDRKRQPIGTVLVSKQIESYELQRVSKDDSIQLRGDRVTASPMLLNWVSHAELTWPAEMPPIKKGLLLSGEKLIDNKNFRDQLVKLTGQPLGGEMEGAGLYVSCQTAKVDWLLVKAVCDWADGNKAKDKAAKQAVAAKASAEFVVHMLLKNSESFTSA